MATVTAPGDQPKPKKKESFVKHTAVYGLGTLATQAVSILLLPLYTNLLPVPAYGMLLIIQRIGDMARTCLMANGIRLATLNFWGTSEDEATKATIAPTVSFFVYSTWLATAVLALLFAKPISTFFGYQATPWVVPVGVLMFLLSATTFCPLALMQARLESVAFVVASLAMSLVHFCVAFVGISIMGWGVWSVILAYACAYGVIGTILTARELIKSGVMRPDFQQLKQLVRFSAPFIPAGLFFFVLVGGETLFLAKIAGANSNAVGIYGLGHKIATAVGLLAITPMMQVWSAWMYTAYKEPNHCELFGKAISRIMMVYILAGLGLALLKTEILTVLSAKAYLGAVYVVAPVLIAQSFMILANLMDAPLYVTGKTGRKPYIAAASAAVMTIIYAVAIPYFHARGEAEMGAAYGSVLGLACHALFTYLGTRSVVPIKFEFGRLLLVGGLAILLCLLGNSLGDGFRFIPLKLAAWAAWPAVLWYGGLLSAEEKAIAASTVSGGFERLRAVSSR